MDGRADLAAGMTAKELTGFINRYFEPQDALNIDGGGSTTMYVKNSNLSTTDVVNYPCDNGKYDHYGQRSVRTFILIKKKRMTNYLIRGWIDGESVYYKDGKTHPEYA
ncbi:phosphodiester glycosidase family protein [Bacteroides sp. CR5/BHMF/2]|nr:phosphodiester glycosidase family protein [Bacteroides sp. CR5/BHMF/2]